MLADRQNAAHIQALHLHPRTAIHQDHLKTKRRQAARPKALRAERHEAAHRADLTLDRRQAAFKEQLDANRRLGARLTQKVADHQATSHHVALAADRRQAAMADILKADLHAATLRNEPEQDLPSPHHEDQLALVPSHLGTMDYPIEVSSSGESSHSIHHPQHDHTSQRGTSPLFQNIPIDSIIINSTLLSLFETRTRRRQQRRR